MGFGFVARMLDRSGFEDVGIGGGGPLTGAALAASPSIRFGDIGS